MRLASAVLVTTVTVLFVGLLLVLLRHGGGSGVVVAGGLQRPSVAKVARAVERPPVAANGPSVATPPRSRPRHRSCTPRNWRQRLNPAEGWIDWHESRLDPDAREPTTGAFGLGQLLPSTYVALGLSMSADPCDQITAQRAYLARHYGGSWHAALEHWKEHRFW